MEDNETPTPTDPSPDNDVLVTLGELSDASEPMTTDELIGALTQKQDYSIVKGGLAQPILSRHYTSTDGNPAGGRAMCCGVFIDWQNGPRGRNPDGTLAPANGAFVEDVLRIVKDRLSYYQQSRFACEANGEAIKHIDFALAELDRRRKDRQNRGVEGQNVV